MSHLQISSSNVDNEEDNVIVQERLLPDVDRLQLCHVTVSLLKTCLPSTHRPTQLSASWWRVGTCCCCHHHFRCCSDRRSVQCYFHLCCQTHHSRTCICLGTLVTFGKQVFPCVFSGDGSLIESPPPRVSLRIWWRWWWGIAWRWLGSVSHLKRWVAKKDERVTFKSRDSAMTNKLTINR